MRVLEKNIENSERLGQQARPENEPGTTSYELRHWWGGLYMDFEIWANF